MGNIIEIKMKRSYLFGIPILFIFVFFGLLFYSYNPSEELSLLIYLIIIFLPLIIIILLVDGYFVRFSLTENAIIKKSLLINKVIELDEITELKVFKYPQSIRIKTKNTKLGIGWDYERTQEFKELLIKELEKRQIPIVYKNNWW
ncbi:MAG: hypothetical protein WDA08_08445 [Weeksellaceae bacterium]